MARPSYSRKSQQEKDSFFDTSPRSFVFSKDNQPQKDNHTDNDNDNGCAISHTPESFLQNHY
jgi:hypothetical protein